MKTKNKNSHDSVVRSRRQQAEKQRHSTALVNDTLHEVIVKSSHLRDDLNGKKTISKKNTIKTLDSILEMIGLIAVLSKHPE